MPIEPCRYCGEVRVTSLWHAACAECFAAVVLPALKAGEPFVERSRSQDRREWKAAKAAAEKGP